MFSNTSRCRPGAVRTGSPWLYWNGHRVRAEGEPVCRDGGHAQPHCHQAADVTQSWQ